MHLLGLLLLTFRELWAKKITMGLFLVATLVWVLMAFALNLDVVDGTIAGLRIFGDQVVQPTVDPETGEVTGEAMTVERFLIEVESVVAGAAYWVALLLGLFATAPLLSGLLERGRIDLMLSKPISRTLLLSGHVLGVWLAVLTMALYLFGMVWIVLSVKTGLWHGSFFLTVLVVVGIFAVMYSVVTFLTVLTNSTALALIVTYGLLFASIFLSFHDELAPQINRPWRSVYLAIYHVLPKPVEVTMTAVQLVRMEPVASWYPFFSTLAFGAVLYGAAAVWFNRRDF